MYPLHDNYCLQLVRDSSQCLNIELYHHGILTRIMSLNKDQCSTLTHSLCETINEFDVLITDLLETSMSNVSVTVDENLQMSFLVRFGSRNYEKLWLFKIELKLVTNATDEISFDPSDWNDLRLLGHKIIDNMIDYMREVRLRPTWRLLSLRIKQTILNSDLSMQGQSP
ncbi:unnamed protein product [Rotaria sp. Silwood2]|nr:unnamed protein product [Rotaria sp. Silwood2]